jgi:hypothetical protein
MTDSPSYPLRVGRGYYGGPAGNFRWGDYGGISIDPSDRSAWLFHEWSTVSHDWSTWFGEIPGEPQIPDLVYPADGAEDVHYAITYDWDCAGVDTFVIEIDDDLSFSPPLISASVDESAFSDSSLVPGYQYYWRVMAKNHCGESDFSDAWSFRPCGILHGNADGLTDLDIDDIVYLIAYIFSSGPPPDPYWLGDADCSTEVDIDDVVYLIAYIFGGGPEPCGAC